jgi:hypothetical protein
MITIYFIESFNFVIYQKLKFYFLNQNFNYYYFDLVIFLILNNFDELYLFNNLSKYFHSSCFIHLII